MRGVQEIQFEQIQKRINKRRRLTKQKCDDVYNQALDDAITEVYKYLIK